MPAIKPTDTHRQRGVPEPPDETVPVIKPKPPDNQSRTLKLHRAVLERRVCVEPPAETVPVMKPKRREPPTGVSSNASRNCAVYQVQQLFPTTNHGL